MADTPSNRTPREQQGREAEARAKTWVRPETLPTPEPRNGVSYRYIRTSMVGASDNTNVSSKFREGWVPVKASEFPELKIMSDHDTRFPDNIEIGGLLLCQIDSDLMAQRKEHYTKAAHNQIRAVDESYLRQSDPRMPVLASERHTKTSFGRD